jgi:hypothetical protein
MGDVRAGLLDGLWISPLLKQDFAEIAPAATRGNAVDVGWQVRRCGVMRRHDQRHLQLRCDAAQIRQQVADVLTAARVGLIPKPAIESNMHGYLVFSSFRFPNLKIEDWLHG